MSAKSPTIPPSPAARPTSPRHSATFANSPESQSTKCTNLSCPAPVCGGRCCARCRRQNLSCIDICRRLPLVHTPKRRLRSSAWSASSSMAARRAPVLVVRVRAPHGKARRMLADVTKWQIADVHAVDHHGTRDAENAGRVVRAQFLVFGQEWHPFSRRSYARCRTRGRRRSSLTFEEAADKAKAPCHGSTRSPRPPHLPTNSGKCYPCV